MKKKSPIKLWNMTDLADSWGLKRGSSFKYFKKGRLPEFTHYHNDEVFWDVLPGKPIPALRGRPICENCSKLKEKK